MIKKRVTAVRRVVSHFDPALANIDSERLKRYIETLDIEDLGDISALTSRPTIFEIAPLKSKYEYLAYSSGSLDYWGIFATHVTRIEGWGEIERTPDGDISGKERDVFPSNVVQNIADIVITLATSTGSEGFFSPPGGFWACIARTRSRNASAKMATVSGAVALDSDPK